MKSLFNLLLLTTCLLMVACKPSPQKAEAYYDRATEPVRNVLLKEDLLIQIITSDTNKSQKASILNKLDTAKNIGNFKELDLAFNNFNYQIATSLNATKDLPEFDGSNTVKNAALDLLNAYQSVSKNEYAQLIAVIKIAPADYTNEDDKRLLDLTEKIDTKLQDKISAFTKQIKVFATNYKFELQKDSI
ncbi:MAG: hypothetical protein WCQ95_06645 [Bacteroidota bacterium]